MGALVVHAPSRAGNHVSSRGPSFVFSDAWCLGGFKLVKSNNNILLWGAWIKSVRLFLFLGILDSARWIL